MRKGVSYKKVKKQSNIKSTQAKEGRERNKEKREKKKRNYQTAPQNTKTASHNHPTPNPPATTLPTPPVAVAIPEFVPDPAPAGVGVGSPPADPEPPPSPPPPLVAAPLGPVVVELGPSLDPVFVDLDPGVVLSALLNLVPVGVPLETVTQEPKLKPALAVPPGRGFGVFVQEATGGDLDTYLP